MRWAWLAVGLLCGMPLGLVLGYLWLVWYFARNRVD